MKANIAKAVLFDELAKPQIGALLMEWRTIRMAEGCSQQQKSDIKTSKPYRRRR
jgi:hypothetical protein